MAKEREERGDPIRLVEQVGDWRTPECEIDRSQRVVKNVALAGQVSRNGYRYTEQALRNAVTLYENKPVFLDHAPSAVRAQERSARDLVGTIINPRFDGQRLRGDVLALETEAGTTFLALCGSNLPSVGMSHVVLVERGTDAAVVEKIREVISVDAVVFPATTQTFREQIQGNTDERVRELESQLVVLRQERDALQRELDSGRVARDLAEVQLRVEELLREQRLPAYAVTAAFRQQLLQARDLVERQELIAERVALVRTCLQQQPSSRERTSDARVADDSAVVRALRS